MVAANRETELATLPPAVRQITIKELNSANKKEKCLWLVLDGKVYDCTKFHEHPGGIEILKKFTDIEAREAFNDVGHTDAARAREDLATMLIGEMTMRKWLYLSALTWESLGHPTGIEETLHTLPIGIHLHFRETSDKKVL